MFYEINGNTNACRSFIFNKMLHILRGMACFMSSNSQLMLRDPVDSALKEFICATYSIDIYLPRMSHLNLSVVLYITAAHHLLYCREIADIA